MRTMTLEEIKSSDKTMLTAAAVAQVLGMRPDYLRHTAIEAPNELPFETIRRVSPDGRITVRFPRKQVLRFLGEEAGA